MTQTARPSRSTIQSSRHARSLLETELTHPAESAHSDSRVWDDAITITQSPFCETNPD